MRRALLSLFVLLAAVVQADAACWQWSKTAGANATADPSINWAEGMSPSSVNDSARAMMARLAECRDDISGLLTVGGSSSAFTITTNQGNIPNPPSDGQQIAFVSGFTSALGVTLAVDGGAAFPIYGQNAVPLPASTLRAGSVYRVTFRSAVNAWALQDFYNTTAGTNSINYSQIQQVTANRLLGNPTGSTADVAEIPLGTGLAFSGGSLVGSPVAAPLAGANGLVITNNAGTPNSIFDISADLATMVTTAGVPILAQSVAVSINTSTTGANGLDTGARASSTWYFLYLISNGSVTAGLASTSATSPTMPVGYTYKVRVGAAFTNGSGNFFGILQRGNRVQYKLNLGALGTAYPVVFNSSAAQALWQAKSLANFVPPTAAQANLAWLASVANGGGAALSPSSAAATILDGVAYIAGNGAPAVGLQQVNIVLESLDVYLGTAGGINTHILSSTGWVDKVNAN